MRYLACLVLLVAACARVPTGVSLRIPVPVAADSRRISYDVATRPGQLTWEETQAIGGRVAELRAEPAEIHLRRGDTVSLQSRVRIMALDSAGAVLGELHGYSFSYTGRDLWMHSDGRVSGRNAARVTWLVRFPESAWKGARAKVPTLVIPILISDTGNTSPEIPSATLR